MFTVILMWLISWFANGSPATSECIVVDPPNAGQCETTRKESLDALNANIHSMTPAQVANMSQQIEATYAACKLNEAQAIRDQNPPPIVTEDPWILIGKQIEAARQWKLFLEWNGLPYNFDIWNLDFVPTNPPSWFTGWNELFVWN